MERLAPKPRTRSARPPLPALLSTGRLEAAAACFAKDACLLTPDSTAVHGRESIRPLLAQLIARHPQIEVEFSNVLIAGDIAFSQERWLVRTDGAEGSRFEQTCESTLILHWIEERWKVVIAAPWGWGS